MDLAIVRITLRKVAVAIIAKMIAVIVAVSLSARHSDEKVILGRSQTPFIIAQTPATADSDGGE